MDVFFPERLTVPSPGRSRDGASADSATSGAAASSTTRKEPDRADEADQTNADQADLPAGAARSVDRPEVDLIGGAYFAEVPVEQISPNPRQPREVFDEQAQEELVASIHQVGLLQPVVVRPRGQHAYELVMGERRWRAARAAGLERIPALVRETGDQDLLRDALLENLHRSELNALEEAAAYGQLLEDFGCTHEELARRIGRSRPQISNTLRLLKLSPLVQRRVAAGVLSAGHARALLGMGDGAAQERVAQRIVAEGLSVRAVEEIAALGESPEERSPRSPRRRASEPGLDEVAGRLADRFDTRVTVDLGKTRGKIVVEFASRDDLARIVALMAPADDGGIDGGDDTWPGLPDPRSEPGAA